MIKRILDLGSPAYVHLKQQQLVVEKENKQKHTFPVEDLGVVILSHPRIVLTQAAIVACQKNNTVIVFCDNRHLPYSVLLPLVEGHSLHSKVLRIQLAVPKPTRKRLWQQIVRHKIGNQAEILSYYQKKARPLEKLVTKVKSGDPENCEAEAAQKYWRLLFGSDFRRDKELDGINALLNYGYAIIRAMVARAIVGSGLHPALGIHHQNQYNGLNLADDLMEPFRPWVDRVVYKLAAKGETEINKVTKASLLNLPAQEVLWQGKKLPLMVSCHYLLADFKRSLQDAARNLDYPVSSFSK